MPYAPSSLTDYAVRKIEILTGQWAHPALKVLFFFFIFLVAYAYGLDGNVRYVFQATAASSYSLHSLYATVNVIRAVVAAASQFAYARLSDSFGRLQLLIVSVLFYVVGTIICSQAYDIQRYAGGSVLYQIGYSGLMIILQLIIMDSTPLNWRMVCSFVPALPFIINTWISGDVTEAIGTRWSWGIGMWAFIIPLACLPMIVSMLHMEWTARRSPEWKELKQSREDDPDHVQVSWITYFIDLFHQLDVIGLLLVVVVFGLILVPLTIAGGVQEQWKHAKIIAPLVIGFVCIPIFAVWEAKFAVNPLLPATLLKERGVWSALIIGVFINFVWYMPNDYMYTVLVVAVNESVKLATRITSLYSFVSVITGTFVGFLVVYIRRLKALIIFGVCMWFVANGLLVYYRSGTESHSGIIGALCLMGFGAGFFTYATQASIQSCTSHKHMAVVTAAYLSSYNIGSAVGAAVSGAVWTQLLYKKLLTRLGDETLATTAYGSPFEFIAEHPWGTPIRMEMVAAYNQVQRILCIIGLCCVVPLFIASFLLRNYRLDSKQSLDGVELFEDKHANWRDIFRITGSDRFDGTPETESDYVHEDIEKRSQADAFGADKNLYPGSDSTDHASEKK